MMATTTLPPQPITWTKTDVVVVDYPRASADIAQAWIHQRGQLERISQLQDNWDGEGARAPSSEILSSLNDLFEKMVKAKSPPPSRIVATVDGTISIEWHSAPVFASMEINHPYVGEWLVERPGYRPEFRVEKWTPAKSTITSISGMLSSPF